MLCGGRIEQRIDNYVFAHSFLRKTQEFAFSLSLDHNLQYINIWWFFLWYAAWHMQYTKSCLWNRAYRKPGVRQMFSGHPQVLICSRHIPGKCPGSRIDQYAYFIKALVICLCLFVRLFGKRENEHMGHPKIKGFDDDLPFWVTQKNIGQQVGTLWRFCPILNRPSASGGVLTSEIAL